jgi:hypothetical protein
LQRAAARMLSWALVMEHAKIMAKVKIAFLI